MAISLKLRLSNNTIFELNPQKDPLLAAHLSRPQAVAHEMIDQINRRDYYAGLFPEPGNLVFLDIGANLGFVSLHASPRCRRIVAVEADPGTCAMMKRNVQAMPNIECVNAALSGDGNPVSLALSRSDYSCHTAVNPTPGSPRVTSRGITFPDLLRECRLDDGVDVCKVDVEGSEMGSLTVPILQSSPVKTWYVEFHKTPGHAREQNGRELSGRFQHAGFSVVLVRPNAIVARR